MPSPSGRVALLSLLAVLGGGTGVAAAATISAEPGGADQFTQPTYTMVPGESAIFENASGESHNVSAKGRGPDRRPLFRSRTISSGTTPVEGAQYLPGGVVYPFVCTIHSGMEAKLSVSSSGGAPVARPDIDVAVPRQSLASVRRSGVLRVRVKALTDSEDVSVLAKKGARRIGSKGSFDLGAGTSRVVAVPLTRSGRGSLGGLEQAAVSARGSVPFGSPDLATRKLR